MTGLAIELLTLHVPAMSRDDAETLAREVSEALRRWPAPPAVSGRVASVKAHVDAPEPEGLADRIAAAVCAAALRELDR